MGDYCAAVGLCRSPSAPFFGKHGVGDASRSHRLGLSPDPAPTTQVFVEPQAWTNRTARTMLDRDALGWSEAGFWDAYADHYRAPRWRSDGLDPAVSALMAAATEAHRPAGWAR